jgi:hypothetical protein
MLIPRYFISFAKYASLLEGVFTGFIEVSCSSVGYCWTSIISFQEFLIL